jgi:hypothetical protein
MEWKLAGLFALLGFIAFVGSWLLMEAAGFEVLPPGEMLTNGVVVVLVFLVGGVWLSRMGIVLVQEILAEERDREEERQRRARRRYEEVVGRIEREQAGSGPAPAEGAGEGAAGA